jgi:hypothetical protein
MTWLSVLMPSLSPIKIKRLIWQALLMDLMEESLLLANLASVQPTERLQVNNSIELLIDLALFYLLLTL